MNADFGLILTVAVWCAAGGIFIYYRRQSRKNPQSSKHGTAVIATRLVSTSK
jgi:hypothetical protein